MALNVTLLASMHDPLHLHYAAQSKVYDEEPARLFVSARGLCGASGAAVPNCTWNVNSSISSWALAGASSRIVDAWVTGEHELEGQDRCGDLLESGEWDQEQYDEMKQLLFHRAEMIISEEEAAA